MKKIYIFLLMFICAFCLSGCGKKVEQPSDLDMILERGYLLAAVPEESVPFGYYNKNKELEGFDIEIAKEISNDIFNVTDGSKVRFVAVTPRTKIQTLNSKKADIIVATMSVNEKRKLIVDFSKPYFMASQKILIRKDSKIKSLNYFNSKGKLAVIMGTTSEKISHIVAPNANIVGVKSYREAGKLLLEKKIDAILGDDCILGGLNKNKFKLLNRAYSQEYYAVAVRKSENSKELLASVDKTISRVLDTKQINIIKSRYKLK